MEILFLRAHTYLLTAHEHKTPLHTPHENELEKAEFYVLPQAQLAQCRLIQYSRLGKLLQLYCLT